MISHGHLTVFGTGTYMSSGDEYSVGLCETPSLQRMKIMDVGTFFAVYTLQYKWLVSAKSSVTDH